MKDKKPRAPKPKKTQADKDRAKHDDNWWGNFQKSLKDGTIRRRKDGSIKPLKQPPPLHHAKGGGPQALDKTPLLQNLVDPISAQIQAEQSLFKYQVSEGVGIFRGDHGVETASDQTNLNVATDHLGLTPPVEEQQFQPTDFLKPLKIEQEPLDWNQGFTAEQDDFVRDSYQQAYQDSMFNDMGYGSWDPQMNVDINFGMNQQPPEADAFTGMHDPQNPFGQKP